MILDLFKLDGKVALVTGANTGLGQGMCLALAEAGASIMGVARHECRETVELIQKAGGKASYTVADLSTPEPIDRIVRETVEKFGKIDILVNNAGAIIRQDAIDYTADAWNKIIAVNQSSVFFLSQRVAKEFILQGSGGKIINVASMLSYQGGIRVPAYTASKSAVLGLTRALANEWASKGICINGIAPGYMATNNTQALREDQERSEAILERIPAGRWGTPTDMAGVVVFLASKASDYVNGFTLAVDGGWLAR